MKFDKIHTFGDLSKSQVIEKMTWLTEAATVSNYDDLEAQNKQILFFIINLSWYGMNKEREFPPAVDQTEPADVHSRIE